MADARTHSMSDADLVLDVRRFRSDVAFSALYDRHTPRAFQVAWRLCGGDTHQAEDVVQEAWVRAYARLHTWSDSEAFGAWLRGITAHVAIDMLRRDLRLTFARDVEAEVQASDVERIDLERAIAALAAGYRAVLVLHDIEGFTHEEIGAKLGITAGTSKGQLFKARRAIRARLTNRSVEEDTR